MLQCIENSVPKIRQKKLLSRLLKMSICGNKKVNNELKGGREGVETLRKLLYVVKGKMEVT